MILINSDISSAYDRVNKKYILHILKALGFPNTLCDLLEKIIYNNKAILKLNNKVIGQFPLNDGIGQGCTLSVILFNIAIIVLSLAMRNTVIFHINIPRNTFKINNSQIEPLFVPDVLYADDIAKFFHSFIYIAKTFEVFKRFAFSLD